MVTREVSDMTIEEKIDAFFREAFKPANERPTKSGYPVTTSTGWNKR
jgi:hypothetical protein